MPRVCVTTLVGLPAAGKTTFCRQLLSLPKLPFNVLHICYDNLLHFKSSSGEAGLRFNFKTERLRVLNLIESLINDINSCGDSFKSSCETYKISTSFHNSSDYIILCDDNNYYTSMRYKIYQLCQANLIHFAQIYFPIDFSLSLERNACRDLQSRVPPHIIQQMALRLEVPNAAKNVWESSTLEIYPNLDQASSFSTFITKVFQYTIPIRSTASPTPKKHHQPNSLVHNLDVLLRHRIKEILDDLEASKAIKGSEAFRLNEKRKEILRNYSKYMEMESINLDNLSDMCKLLY